MRFYGFTTADPPTVVDLPISDEVIDLPADVLAGWAAKIIDRAIVDVHLDPSRPLGVSGGRLADDQDPREWPELPPEWAVINSALRNAAHAKVQSG